MAKVISKNKDDYLILFNKESIALVIVITVLSAFAP